MSTTVKIGIGIAIVAAIAIAAFYVGPSLAKNRALSRCADLKAQLAAASVAGGDPVRIASLQAQIRQCNQDAAALGATVDTALSDLQSCSANYEQIEQEWAHFRSTDYSDTLQRTNTMNTMLRLGEEGARCFSNAIESATTLPQLLALHDKILSEGAIQRAKQEALYHQLAGLDRFPGSTETDSGNKANNWLQRVVNPLWTALGVVDAKIATLDATNAKINTERSVLAANPTSIGASLFGA